MPLEVKPVPKLTYKLRLSPQMRLSLNLLQLPLIRLKEYISEEIEKNPLLELIDSEHIPPKAQLSEVPWTEEDEEKRQYRESLITKPPSLQEHLLRHLHLLTNSTEERKIGELIIGNIDDDGYLRCSMEEIAESAKTTKSKAERALDLIQSFDPSGVGARELRECLLLQLKAKEKEGSLAGQIVDKYLSLLEKKRFDYIAKKLKVPVETIKAALKEIASLEPKPGRSFSAERAIRLIPDALLSKNKEGYEVILNDWELPRITINDKYKKMLKQKTTPEDAKEYLKGRLKAAKGLIDAVNRRKETIQKVIEEIAYVQRDFIYKGVANFKPMTLERIAKRIGKHKSTVSRAITNKYLQTSHGIFELRYFLNSGIKQKNGEYLSSKTIKSKIKDLIKNENKENPLSDQKILEQLNQEGIFISRRVVAKYRAQLKILPSMSRQFMEH